MTASKVLGQLEMAEILEAHGFSNTNEFVTVKGGVHSVWMTKWGQPLMIPVDGPDKVCAEFILRERMNAVLASASMQAKPKKK